MATRLGFIGFGIMGERLLRAALNHDKDVIVVTGVFDPSPGAAARLAEIDPSLEAFATAAEVIAASDCLHIASPPLSHLDYLRQCQAAGKAALCEKAARDGRGARRHRPSMRFVSQEHPGGGELSLRFIVCRGLSQALAR